jgi:electron-transferring-flavoprotein dehydrogenase
MSDVISYDVLLVGGSPSNFMLAHHLVDLAKQSGASFSMAILEKGKEFGAHVMSGAVMKPDILKKVFPNAQADGFPIEAECTESYFTLLGNKNTWTPAPAVVPDGFKKEGYWILTLSHAVNWLNAKLEEKLKDTPNVTCDFFPGFAAHDILWDGNQVTGVQVVEKPTGNPTEDNIYAKVTCFGDKGFISGKIFDKLALRTNPQQWSVGVKEVWQLPTDGPNLEGKVWHTMGYPLVDGSFGGGFVYGCKNNKLIIGLVMSLDSPNPNLNPQQALQTFKKHPWVQSLIGAGKLLKYGAALLPEGGYYSLPKQYGCDGALVLGDALGVLNITNLAGVAPALETGYQAAEVIHTALQSDDFTWTKLADYQKRLENSFVVQNLKQDRYFRLAWQENPRLLTNYLPTVLGGVDAGAPIGGIISVGLKHNPLLAIKDALRLKTCIDGKVDLGPVTYTPDHTHINPNFKAANTAQAGSFNKETIYSREDAVFYANPKYHEENHHIDEFNADVCVKCITLYDSKGLQTPCVADCTAEVHRIDVVADLRKHGMSLENCIQCRTCEIVCPEVNLKVRPTEQGSGPDFMGL